MLKKSHMKRGTLAAAVTVAMIMGGVVQAQAQSGAGTETWGAGAPGASSSGTPVIPQTPATSGTPGGTGTDRTGAGTPPDSGTGMGMGTPNGAGMSNGTGTYGAGASEATDMQGRSEGWGERSTRRSRGSVDSAAITNDNSPITNDSIYPEQ